VGIVVAGFDIHRARITFDALDTNTGDRVEAEVLCPKEAGAQTLLSGSGSAVTLPRRCDPPGIPRC
jgi:hypothetical protein